MVRKPGFISQAPPLTFYVTLGKTISVFCSPPLIETIKICLTHKVVALKLTHVMHSKQSFMCDVLVDKWEEAPTQTQCASVSHLLQLLPQESSPGWGNQKVRLFRVNVKSQNPTEFMSTNCSQQFTKTTEKKEKLVVVDDQCFLQYIHAEKNYECGCWKWDNSTYQKAFCSSTRTKRNSLNWETKT